jgi:bifunctional non-homologous end joining protein LigD
VVGGAVLPGFVFVFISIRATVSATGPPAPIARAVAALGARQAYLDGELCGVGPDGITSFSMIQLASDAGNAAGVVFFLFDLLHLDGDNIAALPLIEHKARLAELLSGERSPLQYSDHRSATGRPFMRSPAR